MQVQSNCSAWIFFRTHLNILFLSILLKEYLLEDEVLFRRDFVYFLDIIIEIVEKVQGDFTTHYFE